METSERIYDNSSRYSPDLGDPGKFYLDQAMTDWIAAVPRRYHWRVASWCSLDDLKQEAYACFYKCLAAYHNGIDYRGEHIYLNRREMMARVQTAYHNRMSDMSRMRSADDVCFGDLAGLDESEEEVMGRTMPVQYEEATLATMIAQAPAELKALIKLLSEDGAAGVDYLKTKLRRTYVNGKLRLRQGRTALRETTNEHYCRLLGLDPDKVDLLAMARQHFG